MRINKGPPQGQTNHQKVCDIFQRFARVSAKEDHLVFGGHVTVLSQDEQTQTLTFGLENERTFREFYEVLKGDNDLLIPFGAAIKTENYVTETNPNPEFQSAIVFDTNQISPERFLAGFKNEI